MRKIMENKIITFKVYAIYGNELSNKIWYHDSSGRILPESKIIDFGLPRIKKGDILRIETNNIGEYKKISLKNKEYKKN